MIVNTLLIFVISIPTLIVVLLVPMQFWAIFVTMRTIPLMFLLSIVIGPLLTKTVRDKRSVIISGVMITVILTILAFFYTGVVDALERSGFTYLPVSY